MKIKIWIVTTCIPERGEGPCLPSPFGTEAEAEAYLESAMMEEWESAGIDEGEDVLPYPGDWRSAQERLKQFHSDGSWGTWQLTPHTIDIVDEMLVVTIKGGMVQSVSGILRTEIVD